MRQQVRTNDDASEEAASKRGMNRVAAGIALSIAAHGALLLAFRYHAPVAKVDHAAVRETLVIHLRAPPPPTPAPPQPVAPTPDVAPPPARTTPRRAQATKPAQAARAAPDVIALPQDSPARPAQEGRFTVAPAQEGPVFDPEAAKQFARSIATRPDPARAGMAVAQIPEKPLATETRAARLIASAKRPDCKDGLPGGLLGPLIMLMDKKDSGCKW